MEKEFIPYEQALTLKELGFDEPCAACYGSYTHKTSELFLNINNPVNIETLVREKTGFNRPTFYVKTPTFSQVFRWFKEKHNLFHEIHIDKTAEPKFCFDIFQYEHFGNYDEIRIGEWYLYRTQEEAELECLKKLIEIVKNK